MLFDLRGRGRRRIVQVVYIGLALLFGAGLVFFGVGAGVGGGGLLNALSEEKGGNSASFSSQIKKYRKLTETQPSNPSGWENLSKALLHESGGENYTTSTGAVTSKGKELFRRASQAWTSYLNLNPPKPNAELAQLIYRIYGEEGLNEPSKAVQALQIVVAARPESAAYYSQLSEFAYKAKNERIGDLAAGKAVSLAPANERTRLKKELAEVKKNPSGEKTYTTTTNGKTYAGKLNSKGELKATEVKTTSTSAGKSGTTSTSTSTTGTSSKTKK